MPEQLIEAWPAIRKPINLLIKSLMLSTDKTFNIFKMHAVSSLDIRLYL